MCTIRGIREERLFRMYELMDPRPFHDHLDVCRQCRERPFDLCPAGEKLFLEAISGEAKPLYKRAKRPS